jgi:hypothetical protein
MLFRHMFMRHMFIRHVLIRHMLIRHMLMRNMLTRYVRIPALATPMGPVEGEGSGNASPHSQAPPSSEAWGPVAVTLELEGGSGGRRRMGVKPSETRRVMTPSAAQGQKMRMVVTDSADRMLSICSSAASNKASPASKPDNADCVLNSSSSAFARVCVCVCV